MFSSTPLSHHASERITLNNQSSKQGGSHRKNYSKEIAKAFFKGFFNVFTQLGVFTFGKSCSSGLLFLFLLSHRFTQYLPSLSQANITRASDSAASVLAVRKVSPYVVASAMNFSAPVAVYPFVLANSLKSA